MTGMLGSWGLVRAWQVLALMWLAGAGLCAEEPPVPQDRPVFGKDTEFEALTEPYTKMARATWPEAKRRFLEGLPEGYVFFINAKLVDKAQGKFEYVFVKVDGISDGLVRGTIDSDLISVTNYRQGDEFICDEEKIRDWTIMAPDRSEEGNYVGKFLDAYQDGVVPLMVKFTIAEDGSVPSAEFLQALNRYQQDISYIIPDEVKRKAEAWFRKRKYDPDKGAGEKYSYVIYLLHEKRIATDEDLNKRKAGDGGEE